MKGTIYRGIDMDAENILPIRGTINAGTLFIRVFWLESGAMNNNCYDKYTTYSFARCISISNQPSYKKKAQGHGRNLGRDLLEWACVRIRKWNKRSMKICGFNNNSKLRS